MHLSYTIIMGSRYGDQSMVGVTVLIALEFQRLSTFLPDTCLGFEEIKNNTVFDNDRVPHVN